jgi:hypothetical protein
VGYPVYYRGEIEIVPPLTEGHRAVALALSKRELNDQTQPIFDAIAASPEPDLPWHTDLFTIAEDGTSILPDEDESRYGLRLWLELLVEHFFQPAGYLLNGEVHWTADELDDRGSIFVKDNLIEAVVDVVINPVPSWSPERFADKQLTDLVRELVASSDATGCSPDLTVVSAQSVEALRTALPRMEDFAMMLE